MPTNHGLLQSMVYIHYNTQMCHIWYHLSVFLCFSLWHDTKYDQSCAKTTQYSFIPLTTNY